MSTERVYVRQLLAGQDIAERDTVAAQMRNFVYLVGDREAGEALLVDPAWDVRGAVDVAAAEGLAVTGVLVTHHHPDHIGGSLFQYQVEGLTELGEHLDVPIHVQREEAPWVRQWAEVSASQLREHEPGDVLTVGAVDVELLHTPGHTPGSQCFLVDRRYLVSGDTLFLDGCGRTDLPGGDPEALYHSLNDVLGRVPDDAFVLPGHMYSPEAAAPMGEIRARNMVYKPRSLEQWLTMFGG